MILTDGERDLVFRGAFELTITYADDHPLRERTKALAVKRGGDPGGMFSGDMEPPP